MLRPGLDKQTRNEEARQVPHKNKIWLAIVLVLSAAALAVNVLLHEIAPPEHPSPTAANAAKVAP